MSNSRPFDVDAIRAWADHDLPVTPDGRMLITVAEWAQIRRDLLAAVAEVDEAKHLIRDALLILLADLRYPERPEIQALNDWLGGQREQEAA